MRASAPPAAASHVVQAWRLLRLIAHLVRGLATEALVFPFVGSQRELAIIRRWSRGLLRVLNVKLHVSGTPPGGRAPTLLVTNHVSWLDIWVIHAVCPVRFVAKSDVRRWPVLGWLVARSGTIFIERTRRHDTGRTNRRIVEVLSRGERVGVFPEGTTTDGTHLRPFHASLFQPALGAGARIVNAAIRYPLPNGAPNPDVAYTGERSLLASLRLILAQPRLRAELIFCGVIEPVGKTRRDLARESHRLIAHALGLSRPGSEPETADGPPDAEP
ncbi:MAG TPA: lysophospholipid acyltransferase family protein [Burkholderiales bacterium]|jgi:1-acyl-sn-glycerol-3-phosphate acyltransferase